MDLVNAIIGVAMTLFFFGAFAMLLTSPSWLVGRLSGKDLGERPPSPLLRSKALRWALWGVASLAAFIGLFFLVMPQMTNVPLGLGLLIPGAIFAQWGAFAIGRARRLARMRLTPSPQYGYMPPTYSTDGYVVPVYPQDVHLSPAPIQTVPLPPAHVPAVDTPEYPLARPVDDEYPPARPTAEYPLARPINPTEGPHA